jgi:hypothetical protein
MKIFDEMFKKKLPVIVPIHLPALPGAPLYDETSVGDIANKAARDAVMLADMGVDGIIIENEGDKLYLKKVEPETIAAMAVIAKAVKDVVKDIPIGINILQSDHIADLAVCKAVDAKFIRAGYFTEAAIVDVGIMEGDGARALRYRKNLSIDSKIFADVQIKHSYPLARRPLLDAVEHAYDRGLVDAVIITGEKTGGEADVEQLQQIKDTRPDIPLIVGSGVTIENLERYVDYIDAIIVGTSLHIDGKLDTDFDFVRVKKFMERIESYR